MRCSVAGVNETFCTGSMISLVSARCPLPARSSVWGGSQDTALPGKLQLFKEVIMLGKKDKGKQKGHLRSTVSNGARMQTRGECS